MNLNEQRNICLTLAEAKHMYTLGGMSREFALRAFAKEELEKDPWEDIRSFNKAIETLGLDKTAITAEIARLQAIENVPTTTIISLVGQYKLSIIKKALHSCLGEQAKSYTPTLSNGNVYYSIPVWYPKDMEDFAYNTVLGDYEDPVTHKKFIITYAFGDPSYEGYGRVGECYPERSIDASLIIEACACQTEELSTHLAVYFMQEIFEAVYPSISLNCTWRLGSTGKYHIAFGDKLETEKMRIYDYVANAIAKWSNDVEDNYSDLRDLMQTLNNAESQMLFNSSNFFKKEFSISRESNAKDYDELINYLCKITEELVIRKINEIKNNYCNVPDCYYHVN